MPAGTLTPKQSRFVDEYLVDLNATQAAIRAGYSARNATKIGHQQLQHELVAAAIAKRKEERSQRTGIDADWVLNRLADEADADLADLYDETGALKPVQDWPAIWRKGLIAGVEVEEIKSEGVTIGLVRKIKISDRIKRIELIGKHVSVQAFREQVEHTGGIALTVSSEDAEL